MQIQYSTGARRLLICTLATRSSHPTLAATADTRNAKKRREVAGASKSRGIRPVRALIGEIVARLRSVWPGTAFIVPSGQRALQQQIGSQLPGRTWQTSFGEQPDAARICLALEHFPIGWNHPIGSNAR